MDDSAVICAFFVKQTTLHRDTGDEVGCSLSLYSSQHTNYDLIKETHPHICVKEKNKHPNEITNWCDANLL